MNKKSTLVRNIGLVSLVLYGVGDILGAGVYGLIGKAAGQMGNAVWLAFLMSMIAAALTGLSYASLGSRYPKAGGVSYITHKAFGKDWLSYGFGLSILASGMTSVATSSRVFAGYLEAMINGSISLTPLMIGFVLVLAFIVFWGIKESMWANSVCTVIELSGLLFIVFFGIGWIGQVDYLDMTTATNPSGDFSIPIMLSGTVLTFYAFIGFEDMLNVAEEVKNPEHNIPRGLLLAIGISSTVYMLISLIAVSAVPATELANSKEPLVDVVRKITPWFPTSIYSVIAMFAVANTALLNMVMGSRLFYGMANQGLLPKVLGKVHHKRRTPYVAVIVTLFIIIALALSGDISSLARSSSVLILTSFMAINASLVVLKRNKKEPKGKFEIPAIIPVFGFLVCGALVLASEGPELKRAGIILAIIAALYFIIRPKNVEEL